MIVKLLTEHHLEFLSLTGGCGGSSESTLVKMSNCWKSQSTAHIAHAVNVQNTKFQRCNVYISYIFDGFTCIPSTNMFL